MDTPAKLILWWDVLPNRESEFFEFNQREFLPTVRKLAIEPAEAWYTAYGNCPQFQVAAICPSLERMQVALASPAWHNLEEKLLDYVENLSRKVVVARAGFQF